MSHTRPENLRTGCPLKGTRVRLKHLHAAGTAYVTGHIWPEQGGLVLNRPIGGCGYWNMDDVETVSETGVNE